MRHKFLAKRAWTAFPCRAKEGAGTSILYGRAALATSTGTGPRRAGLLGRDVGWHFRYGQRPGWFIERSLQSISGSSLVDPAVLGYHAEPRASCQRRCAVTPAKDNPMTHRPSA